MPFALFYRDLTSVVDSWVEAVEKVVTGGAAVGGTAAGSLRGGGGNWCGSCVAVGYADMAARGSWVVAGGKLPEATHTQLTGISGKLY